MRSLPAPIRVGNINLHGKKSKRLSCGCCTAQDLRDKETDRLARRQIIAALRGCRDLINN